MPVHTTLEVRWMDVRSGDVVASANTGDIVSGVTRLAKAPLVVESTDHRDVNTFIETDEGRIIARVLGRVTVERNILTKSERKVEAAEKAIQELQRKVAAAEAARERLAAKVAGAGKDSLYDAMRWTNLDDALKTEAVAEAAKRVLVQLEDPDDNRTVFELMREEEAKATETVVSTARYNSESSNHLAAWASRHRLAGVAEVASGSWVWSSSGTDKAIDEDDRIPNG